MRSCQRKKQRKEGREERKKKGKEEREGRRQGKREGGKKNKKREKEREYKVKNSWDLEFFLYFFSGYRHKHHSVTIASDIHNSNIVYRFACKELYVIPLSLGMPGYS
jgi:hypothetical protein